MSCERRGFRRTVQLGSDHAARQTLSNNNDAAADVWGIHDRPYRWRLAAFFDAARPIETHGEPLRLGNEEPSAS
jgi:hypothetical protein